MNPHAHHPHCSFIYLVSLVPPSFLIFKKYFLEYFEANVKYDFTSKYPSVFL